MGLGARIAGMDGIVSRSRVAIGMVVVLSLVSTLLANGKYIGS